MSIKFPIFFQTNRRFSKCPLLLISLAASQVWFGAFAAQQSPLLLTPPPSQDRRHFIVRFETTIPRKKIADLAWPAGARIRYFPFAAHVMSITLPNDSRSPNLMEQVRQLPGVCQMEELPVHQLQKKWVPNDARFGQQWHLLNTGQLGGTAGMDLQLTNVWENYKGAGVVLAVVDDGVQLIHRDIEENANVQLSYDYLDDDEDAGPTLFSDTHGTQVAGVAAARGNNGLGVCGVAPMVTLVGVRLISAPTTDAQESAALSHALDRVHIMNCSWGAPDGQKGLVGPGPLTRAALRHGAENGRGGRGVIYVFSAGNGAQNGEDANMDGYANDLHTLVVGAVDDRGFAAPYTEAGACVHVVAPSGAPLRAKMTTTDLLGMEGEDPGDYTAEFSGTSAAAPAAAGVVALMLEANPGLSWRDVQEILMLTARAVETNSTEWTTNAAGLHFHPRCGAGLVNAEAAVTLARQWIPLPPQTQYSVVYSNLPVAIPDQHISGVTLNFEIPPLPLRVEHVVATLTLEHSDASQVEVLLMSPQGTASILLPVNSLEPTTAVVAWPFSSVRHWGELAGGTWRIVVKDLRFLDTGRVLAARLDLYGALLPAPYLSRPDASTLLISTPLMEGMGVNLEVSTNLSLWTSVAWTGNTNRQLIYRDSLMAPFRKFYRLLWHQP